MPPKPASTRDDLKALIDLTTSTSALLDQFLITLSPSPATSRTDPVKLPDTTSITNPLPLLADSAKLLKAHTTKLSLLLINDPFTATAIAKVLREMGAAVLPAMMGGAQAVAQAQEQQKRAFPAVVEREVRARVRRIVSAVAEEVVEVRGRAEAVLAAVEGEGGKKKVGKKVDGGRDALSSTGLVWEACDALIEVKDKGMVGVVVGKVEGWRATLLDAVEELKEWGEEGEDDDDEDDLDDSGDEGDSVEDMFSGGDKLGKGNEELRAQLEASLKKAKTITVLYQALVKRRLKTYPGGDASVETLDKLLDILQSIPDSVDEMASAYYDLDGEAAKKVFAKISADAVRASELVKQSWDGKDDEFTAWAAKFQDAINA
ncbi:hypothetical protein BFW01_g2972 [Lasiodiplodia theobromae]|uniref:uncharacterized protein n=1 Tax=Lasiodiplodia theobromae TaxID=45133 RepID=UPI0015C3BBE9|nr:uncharacterized protein LTHEOB_4010 [Lasiodiplodia theobromae]KAF4546702.1 hypothetical protein LTHEOB_4010 [Lasiodiplodia theobromae]KAF9632110.1 hypothetical protein BFW01_g2972 [Lasiodiplodia theobromae]